MRLFGAKGRPADKTFKHDGAYRPPITAKIVPLAAENLGRNVVGRANRRVGKLAARLSPCVDLGPVAHRQLDLVEVHRGPVVAVRLVCSASEQFLVVAGIVFLVEPRRETKIGQFDVTAAIEQDIVRLDIAAWQ